MLSQLYQGCQHPYAGGAQGETETHDEIEDCRVLGSLLAGALEGRTAHSHTHSQAVEAKTTEGGLRGTYQTE